jgi:hypothetical protein
LPTKYWVKRVQDSSLNIAHLMAERWSLHEAIARTCIFNMHVQGHPSFFYFTPIQSSSTSQDRACSVRYLEFLNVNHQTLGSEKKPPAHLHVVSTEEQD